MVEFHEAIVVVVGRDGSFLKCQTCRCHGVISQGKSASETDGLIDASNTTVRNRDCLNILTANPK